MVYIDNTCDCDAIITSYKKRWQVEVFHKNLKSNAGLAKSPTQTLRTQSSHIFMSIYAVFKLECLSIKIRLTPTALRFKLLTNAARSAFEKLTQQRTGPAAAIAVGTPIAERPPHRSEHAQFTHSAPTLGV